MNAIEARRVVDWLAFEVMNGGFDQYFYNSAGDDVDAAIEALHEIGATQTASILLGACSKFPGGMPSRDRVQRYADLRRVNPSGEAFAELDAAFYAYPEDLGALGRICGAVGHVTLRDAD